MIKVLLLNDTLIKGGKERRIIELLKYFKEHFQVDFEIILMFDIVEYPEIYDFGFKTHVIKWSNKESISSYKKVASIAKAFRPDIIHSWSSMTDILSLLLKFKTKAKLISSMIAMTVPQRSLKDKDYLRSKIVFPFTDVITSNSIAGIESYNAPRAKSVCIYNGFNNSRLDHIENASILKKKLGIEDKFIVGMVAAFEPRKDYATLIDAAKILIAKYPGKMAFLLIGDGMLKNEMVEKASGHKSTEIIFTGRIDKVEQYINTFDVGILCTNTTIHGEGISNSILECMALSKPVIATIGGGTSEIIVEKETGFLIAPKNPTVLADKISYVYNQPQQALLMGAAGKKRIEEQFTIETMCNSFYTIYKKLVHKK
jgi:glycosyltransferase involved in cell wall biosynthesis